MAERIESFRLLSDEKHQMLLEKGMQIGQMLGRMIAKPESFCRQYTR